MSVNQSLYERIGGEAAVRATVLRMYDKILGDSDLAPFFENSDVDALRRSQMGFVSFAFGGPKLYTGKSMRVAHANAVTHGLNDHHFNLVAKYLEDAMKELGVNHDLITEALAIVGSTRNDVLNK